MSGFCFISPETLLEEEWLSLLEEEVEDDLVSEDIFIEVVRDVAFESLVELSFRNSLAELRFFGGEEDLELAVDDFLDESCDAVEALRMEVVELFLVEVAED